MRNSTFLLTLASLVLLGIGCGQDAPTPTGSTEPQNVNFKKAPFAVDQSNAVTDNLGLSIGPYFQTFVPQTRKLAQVDLRLIINDVTSPVTTTVGLYTNVQESPVAVVSVVVQPAAPGELYRTISYVFDPAPKLVPGTTHAIGWTGTSVTSWLFGFGDNYAAGAALNGDGTPVNPPADFVFTTYSPR